MRVRTLHALALKKVGCGNKKTRVSENGYLRGHQVLSLMCLSSLALQGSLALSRFVPAVFIVCQCVWVPLGPGR